MSNTTLKAKQHDVGRTITDVLRDANGVIDLTNASGVKLLATNATTGVAKTNAAATIDSPRTSGAVRYALTAADLDTAATYTWEWQITFTDGSVETVPTVGYHKLIVARDLGQ